MVPVTLPSPGNAATIGARELALRTLPWHWGENRTTHDTRLRGDTEGQTGQREEGAKEGGKEKTEKCKTTKNRTVYIKTKMNKNNS